MSIRKRLESAIAGEPVERPVYVAYDWFVDNRDIDWQGMFDLGMGKLNHADLIDPDMPNVEITETKTKQPDGETRLDIKWVTDIGELHEWWVGEWRQEYLIKSKEDYKIMARGLEGTTYKLTEKAFDESESELGDLGVTVGQLGPLGTGRAPFQKIQIDYTGLEKFSIDIGLETPELIELIELMNELMVKQFECILPSKVNQIKLWENLSIETMGPKLFSKYLVPLYQRLYKIIEGTEKRVMVHYDGNVKIISRNIANLPFIDGIDSLTPAPEGDISVAQARKLWPEKFLWLHPSLSLFHTNEANLAAQVKQMVADAGGTRYCLMLSEDIPPHWERTIPAVLKALEEV